MTSESTIVSTCTRSPDVSSVSARVAPSLVLVPSGRPALLRCGGGAPFPAWAPALVLAPVSAGPPALLGASVAARHPVLVLRGVSSVPACDPGLVLTGVTRPVPARVPQLLLGPVPSRGPGLGASVPAGGPALVLRLRRLPARSVRTRRPRVLRQQSGRQPGWGRSHGAQVHAVGLVD